MVDGPVPADLLDGFAAADSHPLTVAVGGRPGAGRSTVARALRGAGLTAAEPGEPGLGDREVDVGVYVFVETLNPDDRAALASAVRPTVAVLNKADLAGFGGNGPMAAAAQRCRQLQRATAVPTRPLAALLAVAGTDPGVLDPAMTAALRTVATEPAALPDAVRRRLAAQLDLFGTACAASAVGSGASRPDIAGVLRSVSGLTEVCAQIDRAAAASRYRRLTVALAALDTGDARTARMLTGDDVVLARMAAAAAVVGAAGATDPVGTGQSDHLRRAIHWQRYARGPVSALHRACALDIARGAMRLWARADGIPAVPR